MDIHRCRFVPFQPEAINALAFSHTSKPKENTPGNLRLALGRANGDIEIWNPLNGDWFQERIFRGSARRTIEQLHWTQEVIISDEDTPQRKAQNGSLRLFSSGGSASLTEWDTEKGIPLRHANSNSKDIWCFAPQPRWTESQLRNNSSQARAAPAQLLAAGCADGSIVLFSTADGDLRFDRVLARPHTKNSRCLCITWRDRNTVVAGFEESVIRIFDIRNRQLVRTLTLGKARDGGKPLVWAVKCLPDGTILSGDSTGELKIWDSQYFSLAQRLKTHNADILDIVTNTSGTMILTCGVDRRTVAYGINSRSSVPKTQSWYEIRHRRFHEHDVKAMCSFESKTLNIAVSGGVDTVPIILPLKDWNQNYHRSLSHLPQRPQMSVSATQRFLLTWWAHDLFIWHLPSRRLIGGLEQHQANHELLGRIQLGIDDNITSAAISSNGTMIVAATATSVKVFQLRRTRSASEVGVIKTRPVELPRNIAENGASIVGFSPDSNWIYALRLNGVLALIKILPGAAPKDQPMFHKTIVKLDRRKRKHPSDMKRTATQYNRQISCVVFSSDSRILAVGDLSGAIDTWILQNYKQDVSSGAAGNTSHDPISDANSNSNSDSDSDSDSDDETNSSLLQGQKWVRMPAGSQLPSLESAILAMTFRPDWAVVSSQQRLDHQGQLTPPRDNSDHSLSKSSLSQTGLLIAVTADHQVVEFDTVSCRLSEWSRRNSKSMLPEDFRQIKDRTMGLWVDFRPSKAVYRLWLYGPTFIYMLDLNRDLATTYPTTSLVKVGRLGKHVIEAPFHHRMAKLGSESTSNERHKKRKRNNTGAGDEMSEDQSYSFSMKSRNGVKSNDLHHSTTVLQDSPSTELIADDDGSGMEIDKVEEQSQGSLAVQLADIASPGETGQVVQYDRQLNQGDVEPTSFQSWHTFQYRAIFGACALTGAVMDQGLCFEPADVPEVILVERPIHDVELLPRFAGGQDW